MASREINIKITGDAKGATSALDRLRKNTGRTQKRLGRFGKRVGKISKGIGRGMKTAGVAAAAGLTAMSAAALGAAQKTAELGDKIAKSAAKTGLTTDTWQELEYAFGQMGVNAATFQRSAERLNQRMGRAAQGNEKYAKAFDEIGVSVKDAEGNMRSADDVMADVLNSLGEMENDAERAALAGELLGTRAGRHLASALGEGGEGIEKLREQARDLGIVIGEDTLKAGERFQDSMDNLKRSTKTLGLTIGGALLPVLADDILPIITKEVVPVMRELADWVGEKLKVAVNRAIPKIKEFVGIAKDWIERFRSLKDEIEENHGWITDLAERVGELIGKFGPFILIGAKVAAVLGSILGIVGQFLGPLKLMVKSLKGVSVSLGIISAPALLVVGALAALAAGMVYAYNESETFREIVDEVWQKVQVYFDDAVKFIDNLLRGFIRWAEQAWERFGEDIMKTADEVWAAIQEIVESTIERIQDTIDKVTAVIAWIMERWGDEIRDYVKKIWSVINRIIESALKVIRGVFNVFAGIFSGDWDRFWTGIKQIFSGLMGAVTAIFRGLWETLKTVFRIGMNALGRAWRAAWNAVKDYVGDRISDIVGFFIELPGRITRGMGAIGGTIANFLSEQFNIVKARILGAINDMVEWFRELPGRILDAIGNIGSKIASKFTFGITGSGQGDGPGAPPGGAGGKALGKVKSVLSSFPSASVTSTYRSPSHNRRVGGSPTSYHLDRENPAVDIVAPSAAILDSIAARLRKLGGWREFLWRVPNHAPGDNMHIHVAHSGGTVSPSWPTIPGLRSDERPAILQTGEEILSRRDRARGRGNAPIVNNYNYGHDPAEVDRRTRRAIKQTATDWKV